MTAWIRYIGYTISTSNSGHGMDKLYVTPIQSGSLCDSNTELPVAPCSKGSGTLTFYLGMFQVSSLFDRKRPHYKDIKQYVSNKEI
jgi:hypothetical protein